MKTMSKKQKAFNEFRFEGLNVREHSNKYIELDRVNKEETKIIVTVSENHIKPTKYGYMLILDVNHVVFLKDWQVDINWYGVQVLLTKEYFNAKEFGCWEDFWEAEDGQLEWNYWLELAKEQRDITEEMQEEYAEFRMRPRARWSK